MAVTWTVDVTVEDIANEIVRVVAMASDDATDPPKTTTVALSADISTPALKIAALDRLWAKYLVKVNKATAIATVIGDLEAAAKANLEGRSV